MHVVYSILMGLKNTILSLLTGGLAGIGVTLFLMSAGPMLPWFPVILVAMAAVVYQVGGGARKTDDDIAIDASPPTTSPSVTQLMDAIPAPLVLLESDRSVAHANPTATAYLGTSLDQLLGTTLDAAAEGSLAPVSGPSHALRIGSGSPQIVVCLARDEPAPAEDLLREITRQRDDALEHSISKSLFVMGM